MTATARKLAILFYNTPALRHDRREGPQPAHPSKVGTQNSLSLTVSTSSSPNWLLMKSPVTFTCFGSPPCATPGKKESEADRRVRLEATETLARSLEAARGADR